MCSITWTTVSFPPPVAVQREGSFSWMPAPFQPLVLGPRQPRGSVGFLYSPVWSQVSPTCGHEQTGYAGMSVWKTSKGGRQGRARIRRPDVEMRICRAKISKAACARCRKPSPSLIGMLPRELGACCVSKCGSLSLSEAHLVQMQYVSLLLEAAASLGPTG